MCACLVLILLFELHLDENLKELLQQVNVLQRIYFVRASVLQMDGAIRFSLFHASTRAQCFIMSICFQGALLLAVYLQFQLPVHQGTTPVPKKNLYPAGVSG